MNGPSSAGCSSTTGCSARMGPSAATAATISPTVLPSHGPSAAAYAKSSPNAMRATSPTPAPSSPTSGTAGPTTSPRRSPCPSKTTLKWASAASTTGGPPRTTRLLPPVRGRIRPPEPTIERIQDALSTFLRCLVSCRSKADDAFTEAMPDVWNPWAVLKATSPSTG